MAKNVVKQSIQEGGLGARFLVKFNIAFKANGLGDSWVKEGVWRKMIKGLDNSSWYVKEPKKPH